MWERECQSECRGETSKGVTDGWTEECLGWGMTEGRRTGFDQMKALTRKGMTDGRTDIPGVEYDGGEFRSDESI